MYPVPVPGKSRGHRRAHVARGPGEEDRTPSTTYSHEFCGIRRIHSAVSPFPRYLVQARTDIQIFGISLGIRHADASTKTNRWATDEQPTRIKARRSKRLVLRRLPGSGETTVMLMTVRQAEQKEGIERLNGPETELC